MVGSPLTAALLCGTTACVIAAIALGIGRAARRAEWSRPWLLAALVAAGMIVWLATTAALEASGLLSVWTDRPPRWQFLPMTALITLVFLGSTRTFRRVVAEIPPWQPVALQTFRIGVELAFWRLHEDGLAPVQVTFEGRNFDILAGLTAPLLAAAIGFGWVGSRVKIAWNLAGLALLVNAIFTVFTSAPGPFHLAWAGEPFTAIAAWPAVWIPALLAPFAVFLHTVSIYQAIGFSAGLHMFDKAKPYTPKEI